MLHKTTSTSPTLSTGTRTSDTNSTPTSSQNPAASSSNPANNFNYAELFEDVNWNEVNLIDIEKQWRDELDQIEKVLFSNLTAFHSLLLG